MSDISKYIDYGDAPIVEFYRVCEEMPNVKFILAERKISELLMIIATSSKLQDVIARAVKGFNFRSALTNARIRTGRRQTLLMPTDARQQIAFAVNLLYAIDTKALPLQDFIEEFYWSQSGINFSFSLFAHSVVLPLRASVEAELAPKAPEPIKQEPTPLEEEPILTPSAILPKDASEDVIERLADLCEIAHDESDITAEEKKGLYAKATAVRESINGDGIALRASMSELIEYVGAGRLAERLKERVEELDETLKHYEV
ncbi:MAG: hypothetical protein IJX05_01850 [Clostridia bacterium]|nr:hypothetical protein [Clostridia bacterium]